MFFFSFYQELLVQFVHLSEKFYIAVLIFSISRSNAKLPHIFAWTFMFSSGPFLCSRSYRIRHGFTVLNFVKLILMFISTNSSSLPISPLIALLVSPLLMIDWKEFWRCNQFGCDLVVRRVPRCSSRLYGHSTEWQNVSTMVKASNKVELYHQICLTSAYNSSSGLR